MEIINLQDRLANKPHYDVQISLHPRKSNQTVTSQFLEIVSNPVVLEAETARISKDVLIEKNVEYFRYALLDHLEGIQQGRIKLGQFDDRSLKSGKIGAFLHAEFGSALEKGHTEVTLFNHASKAQFPIPKAYHVLLPDADARNPSLNDVISALIPFERTLREVWRHDVEDVFAISINHHLAAPAVILPSRTLQ